MNKSLVLVMCDVLVLSALSLSTGNGGGESGRSGKLPDEGKGGGPIQTETTSQPCPVASNETSVVTNDTTSFDERIKMLQEQLAETNKVLKIVQEDRDDATNLLSIAKMDLTVVSNLYVAAAKTNGTLVTDSKLKDKVIEDVLERIKILQDQLSATNKELMIVTVDRDVATNQLNVAKLDLFSVSNLYVSAVATNQGLRGEIEISDAEIERLRRRIDDLLKQVARGEISLNELNREIARLNGIITGKDAIIKGKDGIISGKDKKIGELGPLAMLEKERRSRIGTITSSWCKVSFVLSKNKKVERNAPVVAAHGKYYVVVHVDGKRLKEVGDIAVSGNCNGKVVAAYYLKDYPDVCLLELCDFQPTHVLSLGAQKMLSHDDRWWILKAEGNVQHPDIVGQETKGTRTFLGVEFSKSYDTDPVAGDLLLSESQSALVAVYYNDTKGLDALRPKMIGKITPEDIVLYSEWKPEVGRR